MSFDSNIQLSGYGTSEDEALRSMLWPERAVVLELIVYVLYGLKLSLLGWGRIGLLLTLLLRVSTSI